MPLESRNVSGERHTVGIALAPPGADLDRLSPKILL